MVRPVVPALLVSFVVVVGATFFPSLAHAQEIQKLDDFTPAQETQGELAQNQKGIQELEDFRNATEVCMETGSPNLECHTNYTTDNFNAWMTLSILGGKPISVPDDQAGNQGGRKVAYSRGLVGDMGSAIAMIYQNPAATSGTYIADVMNTAGFGVVQPAYAQGLGFASLNPILNTWKTFRNVAYLFFVVIFLVLGFMIMLRQKIGGQTVVTAQQAIPNVIVTLLFVTFSYAIAGLLIDGMYILMFLLLALFNKSSNQFLDMSFLELGFTMVTSGAAVAYKTVGAFSESAQQSLRQFGSDTVGFIGGLTMAVVVALAIALNVFRLFFELLKTYITIILSIAFSPVLLMFGAIPGKNVFGGWMKNLVGNLAAFPVVLLALIVFDELTGGITSPGPGATSQIESGGFLPPYLFGRSGSGVAGALTFSVGLGMILIMPELVTQAKKAMGASGGIFEQFAGDIGKSLKAGWSGGQLVPGLGFTDTNKLPLVGKYLGSGQRVVQTAAVAGGGVGAGVGGLFGGAIQSVGAKHTGVGVPGPGSIPTASKWGRGVGGWIAQRVNHPGFGTQNSSNQSGGKNTQ